MSQLKLACCDFSFPLLPHEHALDLIAMLGLDGVDIGVMGADSHTRPQDITRNVLRASRDLSAKLRRCGLEASDVFLIPGSFKYLSPNHPHAKVRGESRDLFLHVLDYTARCNGRHMSGEPGIPWKGASPADSLKRSAEELAWRVEQAADAGVVFSVEPHLWSVAPTPKQVQRLLKMTPGLTLTLDYSHFAYQDIPDREVEPLLGNASHFHARGAAKKRRQTRLKDSAIDYKRVLSVMKRCRYQGYISLEFEYHDVDPGNEVDVLSETILLRDLLLGHTRK